MIRESRDNRGSEEGFNLRVSNKGDKHTHLNRVQKSGRQIDGIEKSVLDKREN